ncbi:MAG: helix-turn-helix domain-containing protein [Erysipelotrichaceae bacterium]|nr:helix-turn-helix domain-containing protein [Erysipelotrichaceae bacterium]
MNNVKVGQYIRERRKELGLTQQNVADHLGISFQAVSRWETGDGYPEVTVLLQLADILQTTTDKILSGGTYVLKNNRAIDVNDIVEGFASFANLKRCLGDTTYYTAAIEGVNRTMNITLEEYLSSQKNLEVQYTEAIIQLVMKGYTIDMEEARQIIHNEKMIGYIEKYSLK